MRTVLHTVDFLVLHVQLHTQCKSPAGWLLLLPRHSLLARPSNAFTAEHMKAQFNSFLTLFSVFRVKTLSSTWRKFERVSVSMLGEL